MKRKFWAGGLAIALATAGLVGGVATSASATGSTVDQCVPSKAWDEVIVVTEEVSAVLEQKEVSHLEYQRYSWNGGPEAPAPTEVPPSDHWQANTGNYEGAGHGTDPVGKAFQKDKPGNGNADWFFWTEKKVIDTPYVPGKDAIPAVTKTVHHDAVVCPPPVEVVNPVLCSSTGPWYSEDGGDPVVTPEGIQFVATGHKPGLDYRKAASGNLQGWTPVTYTASGSDQLYFRLTINAKADGGPGYQTLSFPGMKTITSDSVSYPLNKTITQLAEQWPHAVITSMGFSMNSGAAAGTTATVTSLTGACGTFDFVQPKPKDHTQWGTWSNPVITCDSQAGDVVQQYRTNVQITTVWENGAWVEQKTEVKTHKPYTVTQADIDALDCAVIAPPTTEPTPPVVTPPTSTPVTPEKVTVRKTVAASTLAHTGGADMTPWLLGGGALLALGLLTLLIPVAKRNRG